MKKIIVLAAVVAMLAAFAGPASAGHGPDVGVLSGVASVGTGGSCPGGPSGTGLGLPAVGGTVSGKYLLDTTDNSGSLPGTFVGLLGGSGSLRVCGDLGPVANVVGAACGASSGSNGVGDAAGHSLSDVKWAATAGGTLPVTGDADGGDENLVAVVQAQGGAACVDGANGFAKKFSVVGVWVLVA